MPILTTGQLGSSNATLTTGGGSVCVRLFNTHTAALTAYLSVVHDSGTAVSILNGMSVDASGSVEVVGLPLGAVDVLKGYAGTASKIDYLVTTCPESVPFSVRAFDANNSLKSGGSAFSPVDITASGRITTADSVASGDGRIVGGLVKSGISTTDTVTAATSNNAFVSFATSYAIPANTLKAGTKVKMRALIVVNDASGSDTLTCNFLLGSTSLIASTAVNPGATTDLHLLEYELTARAAPAAAAAVVGSGWWLTNTGGTMAYGTGLLASTNFATNGALSIYSQAKWSSNTASTSARLETFNVEIVG